MAQTTQSLTMECPYCDHQFLLQLELDTQVWSGSRVDPTIGFSFERHDCPALSALKAY